MTDEHDDFIKESDAKYFDLEERTFQFAKSVAMFIKRLPNNFSNNEYSVQIVRASGSVGVNYIEANESISKKDFVFRIKICRKESMESAYWLRLINETNDDSLSADRKKFWVEANELKRIFCAILIKADK